MEAENKKRLEELVAAIGNFLHTPAHTSFVGSTKRDLEAVQTNILELDYCLPASALEAANLSGQATVLRSNLTLFEDTVDNLNARILAIQDEEQQIPHNTNEDEV